MAIGDSFTEGLEDVNPDGTYRGWADRLATALAAERPDFAYANLAIRGDMMDDIEREQLPAVLSAKPDLVSFCGGGNDIIIPGHDPDEIAARTDAMLAKIRGQGSDILVFTGQDTKIMPVMSLVRSKVAVFNGHLRTMADKYGCYVVDLWGMPALHDQRAWAPDRLHLTPIGHQLVAQKAAEVLGIAVGGAGEVLPWPPEDKPTWLTARRADLVWASTFLVPWVKRLIRGESMGDGLSPKRPDLRPISSPVVSQNGIDQAGDEEASRPARPRRAPADQPRWQIPRVASPVPPEAPEHAG